MIASYIDAIAGSKKLSPYKLKAGRRTFILEPAVLHTHAHHPRVLTSNLCQFIDFELRGIRVQTSSQMKTQYTWTLIATQRGLGTLVEHWNTDQLEQACKEEIRAFTEQVQKSIGACYELFKRALNQGDNLAFSAILNNFRYRVEKWIISQPGFPKTDRSLDFLVSVSFSRFYVALHKRNAADFPNVAAFLGYLRACATSAVQQELRHRTKERGHISIDDDMLHPSALIDNTRIAQVNEAIDQNQVWQRIQDLFPDERNQRLIRLRYVEQLKPAEIAEKYPDEWQTARDVTIDLYSIRKKLRDDPHLRSLAGVDAREE